MKWDIGNISYMLGFFGAILLGLLSGLGVFEATEMITILLVVVGIVIGLMNISVKEKVPMMVAVLLLGGGSAGMSALPFIGGMIESILTALATVFIPAGIVVAFMVIMNRARA